MLPTDDEAELPAPVDLLTGDLRHVAGGSPTLPLPPPVRSFTPDPVPWVFTATW
jgi:hypothetical protein